MRSPYCNDFSYKTKLPQSQSEISFRGAGTAVTLLTIKALRSAYNSGKNVRKVISCKKQILEVFNSSKPDKSSLNRALQLLASLKTGYDLSKLYEWFDPTPSIERIKEKVLTDIIPVMDNSDLESAYSIDLFMSTLFDDGDYNNNAFLDCFSGLDDARHLNMKKNVADKILFSNIHEQEAVLTPDKIKYDDLLLKSMDKKFYSEFFKARANKILSLENRFYNCVNLQFKKFKNTAYEYYLNNFSKAEFSKSQMNEYFKDYIEVVFYQSLYKNITSPVELAKALNIDIDYSKEIIDDIKFENFIKQVDDEQEKILYYKQKINDKIKTPVNIYKPDDIDKVAKYNAKLRNLVLREKNIENLIRQSGLNDTIQELLTKEIQPLRSKIEECKAIIYQINWGDSEAPDFYVWSRGLYDDFNRL